MSGGFEGRGFTIEDARWILPFVEIRVQDQDLNSGTATQVITSGTAITCAILALFGVGEIEQVWTLSGAQATALTVETGDVGDPNGVLAAGAIQSVAVGKTILGGAGAQHASAAQVALAAPYTPSCTFRATGGTGQVVDEATAGDIRLRTYFIGMPTTFVDWNVTS